MPRRLGTSTKLRRGPHNFTGSSKMSTPISQSTILSTLRSRRPKHRQPSPGHFTNLNSSPTNHATTKALLALIRTCKSTYPLALRYLYAHCLFIDSQSRLQSITSVFSSNGSLVLPDSDMPNIREHSTSLYLGPIDDKTHSIHDNDIVSAVCKFLSNLAPNLRRLMIDMPLMIGRSVRYEMLAYKRTKNL